MTSWAWMRKSAALIWEDWSEQNAPLFPINAAMLVFCLLYRYGGALR